MKKFIKENIKIFAVLELILLIFFIFFFIGLSFFKNYNNSSDKKDIEQQIGIEVHVNSAEEFINRVSEFKKNVNYYKVTYNDIIFNAYTMYYSENRYGWEYNIYYNDELFYNSSLDYGEIFSNNRMYLLNDGTNKAFVLISEISPVGAVALYSVVVFDEIGNVLFNKIVEDIKVDNNVISYSFESEMGLQIVLSTEASINDNFCDYLNENYEDDNYVVAGDYEYQYIDGNLELSYKNEITIKNYKDRRNCK